jgi:hypothetical protein
MHETSLDVDVPMVMTAGQMLGLGVTSTPPLVGD